MDRIKRRRAQHKDAAELDVTSFMNLMIVLVPVLLLSMVFTQTTIIDLNFPTNSDGSTEIDPQAVHLEVIVTEKALLVADGRGGLIKKVPRVASGHDFEQLAKVMLEIKRRMPDKRDVTILLEDDTNYQTLVFVMDRVRSHKVMQDDELVNVELFPVISLGDAHLPAAWAAASAISTKGRAS